MISRVYKNSSGYIALDSDMLGERKRLSTGKKFDKRQAKWYEKHFEQEYAKLYEKKFGRHSNTNLTFDKYGEMVMNITSSTRSDFSQRNAMTIFKNLCKFFGSMQIDEIRASDVMLWQNDCGLAPKTILNYRGYLNLILQTAMNDDIIRKNPVPLVKAPKKRFVKKTTVYYEEDIRKLIAAADGQLKNYIQLCFFSGMRGSEMIALRWKEDIDFERGVIIVDSRIREGLEGIPKSGRTRYIPMFQQACEALMRQRMRTGLSEYVFLNQYGERYQRPDPPSISFKKLTQKIGVEVGTMHDARRSFNTLLKQYGYPPDWILDVMGHVDESMNRNHYTGNLQVDMNKIGKIAL